MYKKIIFFLALTICSILVVVFDKGKTKRFILQNLTNQIEREIERELNKNFKREKEKDDKCLTDNKLCVVVKKDQIEQNPYHIDNYDGNDEIYKESYFSGIGNISNNYGYQLNYLFTLFSTEHVNTPTIELIISQFVEFYENLKYFISILIISMLNIMRSYGFVALSVIKILFLWYIIVEPYMIWLYMYTKEGYVSLSFETKKYIGCIIVGGILLYHLIYLGIINAVVNKISAFYKYVLKKLFVLNTYLFTSFPYLCSVFVYFLLIRTISMSVVSLFVNFIIVPFPLLYSVLVIFKYVYIPHVSVQLLLKSEKVEEEEEDTDCMYHHRKEDLKKKKTKKEQDEEEKEKEKEEPKLTDTYMKEEGEEKKIENSFELRKRRTEKKDHNNNNNNKIMNKENIENEQIITYDNTLEKRNSLDIVKLVKIKSDQNTLSHNISFLLEFWLFVHILQFIKSILFFQNSKRIPFLFEYFILCIIVIDLSEKIHDYLFYKNFRSSVVTRFLKNVLINTVDFLLYFLFNVRIQNNARKKVSLKKKLNEKNKEEEFEYSQRSNILVQFSNIVKEHIKANNAIKTTFIFVKSFVTEYVSDNLKLPPYVKFIINLLIHIPQLILLVFPSFVLKLYFFYFYFAFPIFGSLKCMENKNTNDDKIYFICYFFLYKIASIVVNFSLFKCLPFYNLYKLLLTISVQTTLNHIFNILKNTQ